MCTDSWPFPPTFFNSPFFPIMIIFGPTKSVRTMMSNIFLFTITLLLTHIFIWSWHMFLVGQFCILFLKYLLLSPTCCNWSNFCLVIIFFYSCMCIYMHSYIIIPKILARFYIKPNMRNLNWPWVWDLPYGQKVWTLKSSRIWADACTYTGSYIDACV